MTFNINSFNAGNLKKNKKKTYRWQFLNIFIWCSKWGKSNLLEMFKLRIIKGNTFSLSQMNENNVHTHTITWENWANSLSVSMGIWPSNSWQQSLLEEIESQKQEKQLNVNMNKLGPK